MKHSGIIKSDAEPSGAIIDGLVLLVERITIGVCLALSFYVWGVILWEFVRGLFGL